MAYECDIEATAERDLYSSAIGPMEDRLILRAGDKFRIKTIHCHNGPYTCEGGPKGRFTVPRSWLVECGALKPLGQTQAGTEVEIVGEGRHGPEWGGRSWSLALFPDGSTSRLHEGDFREDGETR